MENMNMMNIFGSTRFNAEDETTTPETTGTKTELTPVQKGLIAVGTFAAVGFITFAAIDKGLDAVDHVGVEVNKGKAFVEAAKAKKASKEAAEIAAFQKSLLDAGMTPEAVNALVVEKYGK